MRIYTKAGDLAFSTFTFPDGQPHFRLETYEIEFRSVTVEMAIRNPLELFQACLVSQVLRQHGYSEVNLDIRYLMGARMDRAISSDQPFTLELVARLINGAGFTKVRILDAHSEVAIRLIRNSENLLPFKAFTQATLACGSPAIVCPDKGARERVQRLAKYESAGPLIYCSKKRDMATGKLSGFEVLDYQSMDKPFTENVLIVDDICDGGGTFVGLAKELRAAGAKKVNLFVTHGIFSNGPDALEGIDHIYTTDSYVPNRREGNWGYIPVKPVTIIPISMEKL